MVIPFTWNIYPNPFLEYTIVNFSNPANHLFVLKLFDLSGKIVREYKSDSNQIIIRKQSLAEGFYVLQFISDNISQKDMVIISK